MPTTPVWMTLFEIADLFGVFSSDVRKIIRSAYKSRELDEQITMRYIKNGNRISMDVYSLEMITAISFRICSRESTFSENTCLKNCCVKIKTLITYCLG